MKTIANKVQPGMKVLGRMDFGGFPFGPTYTLEVLSRERVNEYTLKFVVHSPQHGTEEVYIEDEEEVEVVE